MKSLPWIGIIDSLLPKRRRFRTRVFFESRLVVAIVCVAMVTAFATGFPLVIALQHKAGYATLVFGILMVFLLIAIKFGLNPNLSMVSLELFTGFHFLACRALEQSLDWPLITWLSIFPLLRLLYGGILHAFYGFFYTCLLGIGMYFLELYPVFVGEPVEGHISLLRSIALLPAVFSITAVFYYLRKEALFRAEEASKARTMFLANMSHELRTPMNGVLGITEILLSEQNVHHIREPLELIHRSGKQMVALINDILDFTRLESMKLELELVPVNLRSLIQDVVLLLKPLAVGKGLHFSAEIAVGLDTFILTDPIRCKQILTNILNNAIKFTETGTVFVRAYTDKDKFVVQIEDTGIGMSEDTLKRIFVPFQQADASFTRRFGGSGLGLAISQRLATLLGGKISVNTTLDKGSHFQITLPLQKVHSDTISHLDNSLELPQIPKKILLVEDNEVNQLVALGMLKKCGCQVKTKGNGEEALFAFQSESFDLILMDCHMPIMDGFQATREIRKLESHTNKTKIVALTASAMEEDIQACLSAGMDSVIAKPLTFDSLIPILLDL